MQKIKTNSKYSFYKDEGKYIWDVREHSGRIGRMLFSFDGKKVYSLFEDYLHNLTKEEKELYDAENPRLAMLMCSSEEEYKKLKKRIEEMDEDE